MKEIPLTQGMVAIVDDEDYERLNQFKWHCDGHGYAKRVTSRKNIQRKWIFMQYEIIGHPEIGLQLDHINRNPLDNRKKNLRICTVSQNQANSLIRSDNTSGRKGVSWSKQSNKWVAGIRYHGKRIYIGLYDDLDQAATAYYNAALELFGEFANA